MMLKPFEALYQLASSTKNYLYEKEVFKSVEVASSVISIGNLSFGGTGKTPCIEFLANELSSIFKVAIVCRSYKAQTETAAKVDLSQKHAALKFGDEACLLQQKLPQCQVWTGPVKYLTAIASQAEKPDLLLIDDGFSHRQLKRDFDLILMDASIGDSDYLRESMQSLSRAHAVVLTKTNLASDQQIELLKNKIIAASAHLEHAIYLAATETKIAIDKNRPLFVFCGLAKPYSFRDSLSEQGFKVETFEAFADHFAYSESDQEKILNLYLEKKKQIPALAMLTTEKDAIKITNKGLLEELNVAKHKMTINDKDKVGLLEKIRTNL